MSLSDIDDQLNNDNVRCVRIFTSTTRKQVSCLCMFIALISHCLSLSSHPCSHARSRPLDLQTHMTTLHGVINQGPTSLHSPPNQGGETSLTKLPCESIKTQPFLIVRCLQKSVNVTWLGRVILSNYFDATFDEYCFTDDVTGACIVTEGKIPCVNFYMVSE